MTTYIDGDVVCPECGADLESYAAYCDAIPSIGFYWVCPECDYSQLYGTMPKEDELIECPDESNDV